MPIKPLETKPRALCLNLRRGATETLALLSLYLTLLAYIWILRVIHCDIPLAVSRAIALLPLKCTIMTEGAAGSPWQPQRTSSALPGTWTKPDHKCSRSQLTFATLMLLCHCVHVCECVY